MAHLKKYLSIYLIFLSMGTCLFLRHEKSKLRQDHFRTKFNRWRYTRPRRLQSLEKLNFIFAFVFFKGQSEKHIFAVTHELLIFLVDTGFTLIADFTKYPRQSIWSQ